MDILEALATEPQKSGGGCRIQRWIDSIDPDAPGYADLVATIVTSDPESPHYRTQEQVAKLLGRLGFRTQYMAVGRHRGDRCGCVT